ncbi:MAG TPA: ribosome silencing factor [Chloroflexota bacterium]|jgi:ribosome-associated protein|nr:ribosome silencing factor [Chloroflexota bacterium]
MASPSEGLDHLTRQDAPDAPQPEAAPRAAEVAPEPDPLQLAKDIVQFASDKGAADILLMDIRRLSIIADYFIICSGDNERQIRAISRGIMDSVDEAWGLDPLHRSGVEQDPAEWVLLDYGSVVVHVFSPQMREFYRLERLWSEAATLLRMQ